MQSGSHLQSSTPNYVGRPPDALPLSPLPVVGIVGGGQLARMTYQAGISLGLSLHILAEHEDDCAALVSPNVTIGSPTSRERLERFVASCDVVTFDHEQVDTNLLQALTPCRALLRPTPATQSLTQNKRRQRRELGDLGFPVPPFRHVDSLDDIRGFASIHGWPLMVKASRGGYDGRGVWPVHNEYEAQQVVAAAARRGAELLVETVVSIDKELAVLVARRASGESMVYPVVETVQRDGICRQLLAPARVPASIQATATTIGKDVADAIGSTGILAVELFLSDGQLIINELAARPHNSGHFSIEGCTTSQFENHLRAILNWPLGDPSLVAPAVATVNVIGNGDVDPRLHRAAALGVPGVRLHLYDKAARDGRKLGHVTALGATIDDALHRARSAERLLTGTDSSVTTR